MSDMHSGGTTALFPDYRMSFKVDEDEYLDHSPTKKQTEMYKHWIHCAKTIKEISKDKRIVIVHNGDAIEGLHHNSIQVISPTIEHHREIHIELMEKFINVSGFTKNNGDELMYVSGTESHTRYEEPKIAKYFDAKYHNELKLKLNGRTIWYTHHGASAGDGANRGDAYRNWLKRIYQNCVFDKVDKPDLVVTAHYHKPIYQSYVFDYHTIHGVILPSWQQKTRYAYKVAPFQRNDIGMTITEISEAGDIRVRPPLLM